MDIRLEGAHRGMNRQRDVPDLPDHYVWGWGALRGHRSHLERAAGGPGMQDWREGLKKKAARCIFRIHGV